MKKVKRSAQPSNNQAGELACLTFSQADLLFALKSHFTSTQRITSESLAFIWQKLLYRRIKETTVDRGFLIEAKNLLIGLPVSSSTKHLLCCYIGHLNRYLAETSENQEFLDEAFDYYKQASEHAPNNGFYYNQLAITSTKIPNHNLATLYYFCKSLMTPSPFINAQEPLTAFFHSVSQRKHRARNAQLPLFLRVCGILYTRISLDTLPNYLTLLSKSTQEYNATDSLYVAVIVISICMNYINSGNTVLMTSYLDFFFVMMGLAIKKEDFILLWGLVSWCARILEVEKGFEGGGLFVDLKYKKYWNDLLKLVNAKLVNEPDLKVYLNAENIPEDSSYHFEDFEIRGFQPLKQTLKIYTKHSITNIKQPQPNPLPLPSPKLSLTRIIFEVFLISKETRIFLLDDSDQFYLNDDVFADESSSGSESDESTDESVVFTDDEIMPNNQKDDDDEEEYEWDDSMMDLKQRKETLQKPIPTSIIASKTTIILDTNVILKPPLYPLLLNFKQIIVPLVVIVELTGLSKSKTPFVEEALEFIKGHCRILTSKGNQVGFQQGIKEVLDGSADETVLDCARMQKGVLITDDLNLRLKAGSCGVVCLGGGEIRRVCGK